MAAKRPGGHSQMTMTSTLSRTNSVARSERRFPLSLRRAKIYRDVTALDPAEFTQALHKSGDPLPSSSGRWTAQKRDGRQLSRLLRARRERPRSRRAAEQRDELAPP